MKIKQLISILEKLPCNDEIKICVEIDNDNSFKFHKAMNFTEANRIIYFTKKL